MEDAGGGTQTVLVTGLHQSGAGPHHQDTALVALSGDQVLQCRRGSRNVPTPALIPSSQWRSRSLCLDRRGRLAARSCSAHQSHSVVYIYPLWIQVCIRFLDPASASSSSSSTFHSPSLATVAATMPQPQNDPARITLPSIHVMFPGMSPAVRLYPHAVHLHLHFRALFLISFPHQTTFSASPNHRGARRAGGTPIRAPTTTTEPLSWIPPLRARRC